MSTNDDREVWTQWINDLLRRSGLRKTDLAQMCGATRGMMSAWTNGQKCPEENYQEKLVGIAERLGLVEKKD